MPPDIPWPTSFSVSDLQQRLSALILELGLGPGSLYDQIVNAPVDPAVHPECDWDAAVRLGEDLSLAERVFLSERKRRMKASFAELMGVPDNEVDERDLPIVAIAGSGGGRYSCRLQDPSADTTWVVSRLSGDAQHPGIAFGGQKPWCARLCIIHRWRVWYGIVIPRRLSLIAWPHRELLGIGNIVLGRGGFQPARGRCCARQGSHTAQLPGYGHARCASDSSHEQGTYQSSRMTWSVALTSYPFIQYLLVSAARFTRSITT